MAIFWLVAAWLAGIVSAGTLQRVELTPVWLLLGIGSLIGVIVSRIRTGPALIFGCVAAFMLGGYRYQSTLIPFTPADLGYYNDRGVVTLTGIVDDFPDVRDTSVNLRISVQSIRDSADNHSISGLALVQVDRFADYRYGDQLRIQAELLTPAVFDTFSYKDYLARGGVYTVIYRPRVDILARDQGSPIIAASFNLRESARQLINRMVPAPQSALLSGILLGNDNDMSLDVRDAFQTTGTSHIIAISGSNISIVAGILFALLRPIRRKWLSALITILGLAIYSAFVGASPSVVRAAFMAGLSLTAVQFGRQSWGLSALAVTVLLQTFINPLVLADAGLILSSLATLGILIYVPGMRHLSDKPVRRLIPNTAIHLAFREILDALLVTIAAQITTLPALLYLFGQNSNVALIVNALVVPVQGPIMSLGLLSVVTGLLVFPLGQLISWLVAIPVSYTLTVIRSFATLPGASMPVHLEIGGLLAIYAVLIAATAYLSRPTEPEKRQWLRGLITDRLSFPTLAVSGGAVCLLVWSMVLARPDGLLHVSILSVGDGSAILLQTPNGARVLIDGGPNGSQLRTALGDRLPFYERTLDLLILTSGKKNTISALPPVLDRYAVNTILSTAALHRNSAMDTLRNALKQTPWLDVQDGQTLQLDQGVKLEVMDLNRTAEDDLQLVIRLTYRDARFLLLPDLPEELADGLLSDPRFLGSTVVYLPGSDLKRVSPDLAGRLAPQMLAVRYEAGSGDAPEPGVLFSHAQTFRTDRSGALDLRTDGHQLWVSTTR